MYLSPLGARKTPPADGLKYPLPELGGIVGSLGSENAVENMRTTCFVTLVLTGCPVSLLGALITTLLCLA